MNKTTSKNIQSLLNFYSVVWKIMQHYCTGQNNIKNGTNMAQTKKPKNLTSTQRHCHCIDLFFCSGSGVFSATQGVLAEMGSLDRFSIPENPEMLKMLWLLVSRSLGLWFGSWAADPIAAHAEAELGCSVLTRGVCWNPWWGGGGIMG